MRLLLLVAMAFAVQAKLMLPFGNGWRFHGGDDPTGPGVGPNSCDFEPLNDATCTNAEIDVNRYTESDCKTSCCYDPDCMVWQYQSGNKGCNHGLKDSVCVPSNTSSTGGKRSQNQPFKRDYNFQMPEFDDGEWKITSVPHDFLINGTFVDGPDAHHAYLPRGTAWYRKHFSIPAEWKGQSIHLAFQGAHHYKEIYINGNWIQDHSAGYTEFTVRLDNVTSLQYGDSNVNVIAIRVDASYGSGHWYEGGGIYRDVHLVCVNATAHFTYRGVYLNPETNGTTLDFSAELQSFNPTVPAGTLIPIKVKVVSRSGMVVAESNFLSWSLQQGQPSMVRDVLKPTGPIELWSIQKPVTYELSVVVGFVENQFTETHNATCAFRTTKWDPGFSLNNVPMKLRGFSHHNSFAGTGTASSTRLNLFRAQSAKALGANFWRCSHNPYVHDLYEVLTLVGIMSWDENRDFGTQYRQQMADMVKHHRSHASVVVWSFCNEVECFKNTNATELAYKSIATDLDPIRPTTCNQLHDGNSIEPSVLDIIGLSHADNQTLELVHSAHPGKPLLLSECCSCTENRDGPRNFTACEQQENSPGTDEPFVAGSIGVWTLMDYFGESQSWPQVVGNFGQFDISGFPKAHSWWYRINWLAKVPKENPSRPLVDAGVHTARVVNLWNSVNSTIYCAVSTKQASLRIDAESFGVKNADVNGMTEWAAAPENAKNITCVALGSTGSQLALHSLLKPKVALKLQLVVDVPSPATGTGSALYLDASDLALVRAQVVDEQGVVNSTVTGNVTFTVSGPGRLVGLGAAPDSHLHVQGNVAGFYGGLIRAVVQVTLDCVSGVADIVNSVDKEHAPLTFTADCPSPAPAIVVTAYSENFGNASISLQTSSAPSDNPFAVARANANLTYTYMDDIVS
ncbi:Beta-galactosidase BoGH2A [Diplonema papillatum]|nr:Beta-galactosidase BoGH2A [Diplonema papillatum]